MKFIKALNLEVVHKFCSKLPVILKPILNRLLGFLENSCKNVIKKYNGRPLLNVISNIRSHSCSGGVRNFEDFIILFISDFHNSY